MFKIKTLIAGILSTLFSLGSGGIALAQASGGGITSSSCAGGSTLGDMFCAFQSSSLVQLMGLVFIISFVGGLYLIGNGLVKLREATDTGGSQTNYSTGFLRLGAGAFLITLPGTIFVGLTSLYGAGVENWAYGAMGPRADTGSLGGDDILSMTGNFAVNAAGPLSTLVMGIAVLIGVILVANSLFGLSKMGSPQGPSMGSVAAKFFVGVALVNTFVLIDAVGASFGLPAYNQNSIMSISNSALTYAGQAQSATDTAARFKALMDLAFLAVIPFGLIAFVRGMLIVKDASDGSKQASMGAGFTHIIGGVALVNGKVVSCAIMATLAGGAGWCA